MATIRKRDQEMAGESPQKGKLERQQDEKPVGRRMQGLRGTAKWVFPVIDKSIRKRKPIAV